MLVAIDDRDVVSDCGADGADAFDIEEDLLWSCEGVDDDEDAEEGGCPLDAYIFTAMVVVVVFVVVVVVVVVVVIVVVVAAAAAVVVRIAIAEICL